MSLQPYPAYKDSSVAWLGDVPASWKVMPFYSVASERNESNKGMVEDNLLSLSYGRIIRKNMESNDGLLPESFETYQVVRPGDIVFRLTDLQNDKRSLRTALVSETGIITSAYLAAKPFGVSSNFLNYLLRSYDVTKVFYSMGGGLRQSMKFDDIKRLPILVPTSDEQHAITTFLDRETGKIDDLIAEQEKLIALLAEKRQATISHAVTKGLNPVAPMRDSGVDWLGRIPTHWAAIPLKYIAKIGNGSTPNRDNMAFWEGGSFPWLNSSVVNLDHVTEAEQFVTDQALRECHLPIITPPAVLIGITGQGRTRGMAATLNITATINQHVAYLKPSDSRLILEYLRRVLDMAYSHLRIESDEAGSTKGAITCQQLENLSVPLPNISEQFQIVSFLTQELAKLDNLADEANCGIDLLKERRTALISAAVTGRIDVRRPSAEIIDLAKARRRLRGLLAVELIEKSQGRPTFGRTALQKHAYLAEAFAGVHELGGRYIRNDYGPLDRDMIDDMESEAQALCGIVTQPPTRTNRSITYLLSRQIGTISNELAQQLGPDRSAKLQRLHALLASLNTHDVEGVATLFAVWNDFLIEKKDPSDDDIVKGFLNDWHPSKKENFNAQELQLRLNWMRRNKLEPTGTGPKTEIGRLFV